MSTYTKNTLSKPIISPNGPQFCSQATQRLLVKENTVSNEFIAYFRVSTQRQGQSGLGLDAQRAAVSQYCESADGALLNSYTEIESGKKSERAELNAALDECRKRGATLLIAKLDRLARNVHFISGLIESGVKFVAIDMPNADRFMLHVYAAMAEEEARRISERTKRALKAAKARGVQLGQNGRKLARLNAKEADLFAREAGEEISRLRLGERMTFREIACFLNRSQTLATARGGKWHEATVHRVFKRHSKLNASARS